MTDYKAQLRAHRASRPIDLDGVELRVREPSIAEVQRFSGGTAEASAEMAAALLVDADGNAVFADAAEAADCLSVGQLSRIAEAVAAFGEDDAAKN
jgi:hypothetical protein